MAVMSDLFILRGRSPTDELRLRQSGQKRCCVLGLHPHAMLVPGESSCFKIGP